METDSTALTSQEKEGTSHAEDAALEQQTSGAELHPLELVAHEVSALRTSRATDCPNRNGTTTTPATMDFTMEFDIIASQVATYSDSAAEPRFSDAEVVAIVLLLARRPLDFTQVIARMIQSFRYFANLAADEIASPKLSSPLNARVHRAICAYGLPLTSTREAKGIRHYQISKTQAFIFLHRHVSRFSTADYDANRPTLLLALPPELRSKIWNHVLCFPESGLRIRYMPDTDHDGTPEITTITRTMDRPFRAADWDQAQYPWNHTSGNLLYAQPLETMLGLLSTHRLITEETTSIFFGANRFHFDNLNELDDFLRNVGPRRLQHLRHVSVFCRQMQLCFGKRLASRCEQLGLAPPVLTKLRDVTAGDSAASGPRTVELDLHLNETVLLLRAPRGAPAYGSPCNFPGIARLAHWSALKVIRLEGDCARTARLFVRPGRRVFANGAELP
ncbi:hypothetical protein LTR53_010508 [Teratosphaeriaceae sp. CCFEE 6253]|nr:hypothetical protein LTR53_010508 [Teratosphaeriaceae sp. CCFEE 6253]